MKKSMKTFIVLLVLQMSATMAWGEIIDNVKYIDANGNEQVAIGVNGLYAGMGTVKVGQYMQLFAVLFPDYATSRSIKWTTSDPTRATVNQSGIVAVVDGAANGDFTITATTVNNKTATLNLKIVDEKIQIDTDQLTQAMAQ